MRHNTTSRPEMLPVDSSSIAAVGYDPDQQAMHVEFSTGRTYQYSDVPAEAHAALLAAPSVGKHFTKHIRNAYTATPL